MIYWGIADDVYWLAVLVYGSALAFFLSGGSLPGVPPDPCANGCGSHSR